VTSTTKFHVTFTLILICSLLSPLLDKSTMNPPRIRGPHIALGLTTSITLFAIYYSHYQQVSDKAQMRAGVERDKERIRRKKEITQRREDELQ
jgi:hypothetical protein